MEKKYFVICGFNNESKEVEYLCLESFAGYYYWDTFRNVNIFYDYESAKKEFNEIINEERESNGNAPYMLRKLAKLDKYKKKDIVNIKIVEIKFNTKIELEIKVEDIN